MIDPKDVYIQKLEETVSNLQLQVNNLTEMVLLLRKEKFGSSSEKTPKDQLDGQLSLFNEVEVEASDVEEPIKKTVKGYSRTNPKTKREELIKDLPVREILCEVPPDECHCDQCSGELKVLGKETVREELEYIPAKLQIARYVRVAYECPKCKRTDKPFIKKALTPTGLMNHSLASPSSVANIMYEKYVNHVPLYRQEKGWEQLGIALSRATMGNWVIRCTHSYLYAIVSHMKKLLVEREVLHCDETKVQVLKEEGRKPQTDSFMWVYCTGNDGKPPIVLFDYKPSRAGENAKNFLGDFKGYLHCDGFSGYNVLEDVTRVGCLAHIRRKFVDAIPTKKGNSDTLSMAEMGREYCNELFALERKFADLSADERKSKRQEQAKPVLEAFWLWLNGLNTLPGSALGKAVTYAKNQWSYFENYLLDGRCSISNNTAENAIRPFTLGRKNWLFADTPKGANASAMIYSIVETAKANNLNVYTYLEYLLLYLPDTDLNDSEQLDALMPWSPEVVAECSL